MSETTDPTAGERGPWHRPGTASCVLNVGEVFDRDAFCPACVSEGVRALMEGGLDAVPDADHLDCRESWRP